MRHWLADCVLAEVARLSALVGLVGKGLCLRVPLGGLISRSRVVCESLDPANSKHLL